jgi:2-C-methyl-D-erythritol 2,4-cyclodiphosphate synthase
VLETELNCVSVKATTTERLGFVGQEQGIAVYAVTLLESV